MIQVFIAILGIGLVGAGIAWIRDLLFKNKAVDLQKQDQALKSKEEILGLAIAVSEADIKSTKAADLTPEQVVEFWGKK